MASIKCAHCKQIHSTVQEVRDCAVLLNNVQFEAVMDEIQARHNLPTVRKTPVERFKEFAAKLPEVETAYYAVQTIDTEVNDGAPFFKFYRVDKPQGGIPKWRGFTFVTVQAGDDFHKIPFGEALTVIEAISQDVEKALANYGHQIGRCGICHRTLTVAESIARGIGPICYGRL